LRAALAELKQCRSESERVDYHIVSAAVAPTRESEGDKAGMIRKVAARLYLERGARYIRKTGERRPYVFDQAITRREAFDEAAATSRKLAAGDKATSRGQPCTVVEIDHEANTCKLRFSARGIEVVREYSCIYKSVDAPRKAPFPKGSARLRPAPPSLRPKPRETRCDEIAEAARPRVEELYDSEGARSPAQRDAVRRRLGVGLYETAQALIVYAKQSALYTLFCQRFPAHKISFSTFKKLRPWFVRRAKEESCCCKHCDNFKQQQTTLHSLVDILQPLLEAPSTAEADDNGDRQSPDAPAQIDDAEESEAASWSGKAALEKLLQFCALKSKSEMVKFTLCDGAFDGGGKQACINGTCPSCGFGKLWSEGLRPHVVDGDSVKSSAPVEFQTEVKWVRIRSSKTQVPGESVTSCYEARRGTIVQFLDEFERESMRKFPQHRFTVQRQKAMDAEFERNRWPGWLQFDVDFAMNGTIPPPQGRSMQSDHWSPMDWTLFVNVVSWLRSDKWVSRVSDLAKGTAVTVEPAEASVPGATEPAAGSYWAEVVSLPVSSSEPVDLERRVYGVRRHGSSSDAPLEMIERRFLRHRVLHTKAYIHVSDDKTHDSHAAQVIAIAFCP
jgi:hypothetical protein